jgi:starch synthase
MIAQRYGTLPIARATGGLRDTIRDGVDGFLFEAAEADALAEAAGRAAAVLGTPAWRTMQRQAMALDRSWGTSAAAYLTRYRTLMGGAP